MIDQKKYRCGNVPEVGDIVDWGARTKRMLVTSIHDETDGFKIMSGDHRYDPSLGVLVARHGHPIPACERPT